MPTRAMAPMNAGARAMALMHACMQVEFRVDAEAQREAAKAARKAEKMAAQARACACGARCPPAGWRGGRVATWLACYAGHCAARSQCLQRRQRAHLRGAVGPKALPGAQSQRVAPLLCMLPLAQAISIARAHITYWPVPLWSRRLLLGLRRPQPMR